MHTLTVQGNIVDGWWENVPRYRPTNTYTITFTLCIEIADTVDAVTKIGLLILAEIQRGKLITKMSVTGTGTETSQTCKHCTNDWWIYLGLQNLFFNKMGVLLGWNVDVRFQ